MALVGADGNPVAAPAQLIDVNQLKTAFGNPKADIPIFYGDAALDNVSAKFLLERIRIAKTTYGWSDETTAGNFKLALRGLAIDWLNHTKDTLDVDISKWTNIEPEFITYFNIKTQTVDNVWDFSKVTHEGKDTPAKLMIEVSKLINNVASTATPFLIPDQANYTKEDVTRLVMDSNKNLKNHLMKTVYINKLQPEYKEYVLSRDPTSLQEANNHAVALWKRKNPEGVTLKPTTVFAIESDFGLKNSNLSEEDKEICINALKNRRNGQNSRQTGGFSDYSNNSGYSNNQSKPKKDKKNKEKSVTIKCWFCDKTGHTQMECRKRKSMNKPLTWRKKEIKSKYHSNKIFSITDLDDIDEIKEYTQKIEEEARLMELPKTQDFQ